MNKEQKIYEDIFKSQIDKAIIGQTTKQIYDSFIEAGFTADQAMELLKVILTAGAMR